VVQPFQMGGSISIYHGFCNALPFRWMQTKQPPHGFEERLTHVSSIVVGVIERGWAPWWW
jgi:hypothetical protein